MATRAQARYEIRAVDATKGAFRSVGRSLDALKKKVLNTGTAITGVVGAAGFGAFVAQSLKSAEGLRALSNATGIAVTEIQKLDKVFSAAGFGDRTIDVLRDLQEGLQEAKAEPTGTKGAALKAFGIDPSDFKNAGVEFVDALSDAFKKKPDIFRLREFAESSGDVIAAVAKDFDRLRKATRATPIFTERGVEQAARTLQEIRIIAADIAKIFQAKIFNTAFFKEVPATLERFRESLQAGTVFEDLEKILGPLIATAPGAFDAIVTASESALTTWLELKQTITEAMASLKEGATAVQEATSMQGLQRGAETSTALAAGPLRALEGDMPGGVLSEAILRVLRLIEGNTAGGARAGG